MKNIYVKNAKTIAELTSDSSSWGNYYDEVLPITSSNAKQSTDDGETYTATTGTKPVDSEIILTTGASNNTGTLNIYDLAGNMWEITLEYTSDYDHPCVYRGGDYQSNGSGNPASSCWNIGTTSSGSYGGFRPSLY